MISSIGGKQVLTWRGPKVVTAAMQVAEITRAGVNGHAFQETGIRAFSVSVTTSVDTDEPEELTNDYLDLQGQLVTVTNIDGEVVQNVMVVAVRILGTQPTLLAVGGITNGGWILTAQWELQATG